MIVQWSLMGGGYGATGGRDGPRVEGVNVVCNDISPVEMRICLTYNE